VSDTPNRSTSFLSGVQSSRVDYIALIRFLIEPFLDSPQSLRIDSEVSPRTKRILIRLAIEGEDKGRVFGRGGRNIQAVRTVIQAVSKAAGDLVYIEVFGSVASDHLKPNDKPQSSRPPPRRPPRPRPKT
jgi:predicted RNA-binding protein YlqC (UPF0109 family)